MNIFEWDEQIPVTANNLNEMQNILNANMSNNFQSNGTILWKNSNPESTFTPQTITLNSNDYDCYEIIFRFTKDINRTNSTGKSLKGSGTICTYAVGGNYYRVINYVSDTSLSVSDGEVITTFGGTPNTDNSWCIPLYVIGYKTGLFE